MNLIPLALLAVQSSIEGQATPDVALDLRLPVRIERVAHHMDGGTISAALVDRDGRTLLVGFDRRIQMGSSTYPRHCFIGARHPTQPEARMLPLWGKEERHVLHLLHEAIGDSLSPEDRQFLLENVTAGDLPRDLPQHLSMELRHLVRAVEERRETLDAIDQGRLASLKATLRYFSAETPPKLTRVTYKRRRFLLELILIDDSQASFGVSLDADLDKRTWTSSVLKRRDYASKAEPGSNEERYLLTLVAMAADRSLSDGSFRADDSSVAVLIRVLERRREQILKDDEAALNTSVFLR